MKKYLPTQFKVLGCFKHRENNKEKSDKTRCHVVYNSFASCIPVYDWTGMWCEICCVDTSAWSSILHGSLYPCLARIHMSTEAHLSWFAPSNSHITQIQRILRLQQGSSLCVLCSHLSFHFFLWVVDVFMIVAGSIHTCRVGSCDLERVSDWNMWVVRMDY